MVRPVGGSLTPKQRGGSSRRHPCPAERPFGLWRRVVPGGLEERDILEARIAQQFLQALPGKRSSHTVRP